MVGLGGLEPPTFALSEQRSNHLSYKPDWWEEKDLNLRTQKRADLQSAAIDHSAIFPTLLYFIKTILKVNNFYTFKTD